MTFTRFRSIYTLSLLFMATLCISLASCSDDEPVVVPGCTDSNADNYNPNATTDNGSCIIAGCNNENADNFNADANQDDGSCTFILRHIGNWSGAFACTGDLAGIFADADITITAGPTSDKVQVFVSTPATMGAAIPVNGEITETTLTITQALVGIPFDLIPNIEGQTFDINIDGVLTLSDDGTTYSGDVTFALAEKTFGNFTANDTCAFTATKQ